MARIQAHYLLDDRSKLAMETSLPQAVGLIRDCMRQLHQPDLAVEVALGFHPVVERWAAWGPWAAALDTILDSGRTRSATADTIRLLNCRSQAARELGDFDTAETTALAALHLAEARGDAVLLAITLNKLGVIAYRHDHLVDALSYWTDAYTVGAQRAPNAELGHLSLNLGIIAVQQGRFAEAHERFNQALGHYKVAGDALHIAKVQCAIGDFQGREGHYAEARQTLLEALDALRMIDARYEYAFAWNDLGCLYMKAGAWEPALEAFTSAVAGLERLGALSAKAWVLGNMVELYVTTAQWEQAQATIKQARELALVCGKPLVVAAIDVDTGRMFAAQGNYAEARKMWIGALQVQQAKGAELDAQHTLDLLADLPPIEAQ